MRNDQELSIDQLSAVIGGATSNQNGSLPYPKPSPMEVLIKWILAKSSDGNPQGGLELSSVRPAALGRAFQTSFHKSLVRLQPAESGCPPSPAAQQQDFRFRRHGGHGRAFCCLDPVANDQIPTFGP